MVPPEESVMVKSLLRSSTTPIAHLITNVKKLLGPPFEEIKVQDFPACVTVSSMLADVEGALLVINVHKTIPLSCVTASP